VSGGPAVRPGDRPVASTWELSTPELRLTLTLSPEPDRGFSGEGAVLTALAAETVTTTSWHGDLPAAVTKLADQQGKSRSHVEAPRLVRLAGPA
jgi:hypothetical protein